MFKVFLCIATEHDWRLVPFAALVCIGSSLATFYLYARTPAGPFGRRTIWLTTTAVVAGSGIWTTHFVAMLAFETGLPVAYDAGATIGSLAVAIAGAGLGFGLDAWGRAAAGPRWTSLPGGLAIGGGISLMHYVGMSGYRTTGVVGWDAAYVAGSIVSGAVLAAGALWVAGAGASRARQVAAGGLLSLAIVAMHFTGMAAVSIWPDPAITVVPSGLSNAMMASAATGGAALIIITALAGALFNAAGRQRTLTRLRESLDAMPDALAIYDADGRLEAWNTQFADNMSVGGALTVGSTFEMLIQARIKAGVYPEAKGQEAAMLASRVAEFQAATGAWEFQRSDGRWLRLAYRRTASGGTVSSGVDITASKQTEADMAKARDAAEAANRSKSEFLANMSHEIRTPMNGILGMNSLMLLSPLTSDQRRYAETVQSSAEALMRILNDILDMSKLEAGKVRLEQVEFSLQELTRDVMRLVAPSAEEKGVALSCKAAPGWFVGDPGRIRQVLLNLTTNAVKFTQRGTVQVQVQAEQIGKRTRIRVEVADTGIGMTEEAKARLFLPFEQADSSITRRFGGTGLGLSICRQLIQLMDGRIGMEDRPGGGSIFWFELMLTSVEQLAPVLRASA